MKTYAISMLIEHGFRAGDLANFAKEGCGEAAHRGGSGAGQGGQDQEGQAGTPKLSSRERLSEGKLVRAASSGMIM